MIVRFAAALLLALAAFACRAQQPQQLVHLLDYIAVDYAEAVADGKVRDEGEYREMTEFAANVAEGVKRLPENPRRDALAAGAEGLRNLVAQKAAPEKVAAAATALRQSLVAGYAIAVAPRRAPAPARGQALFAEHCAGCHGVNGAGDGVLAKGLDPAPTDFHEAARQRLRSVHSLYNTISLGVAGTAMRAFTELSEDDRWALAYRAAAWGVSDEDAARGKAAWDAGGAREALASHAAVAGQSRAEVESKLGSDAAAVLGYLVRSPALLDQGKPAPLAVARAKLAESLAAYKAGDAAAAHERALAAYLDGFELAENALATVDAALVRRVEALMLEYRAAVKAGVPAAEVAALAGRVDADLAHAAEMLDTHSLSAAAAASTSFLIVFREGLEAVLVVAALVAFLRRSGQARALPYLHAGWIAALVAGSLTWAAATWLVDVSGAGREITEGASALIAAAMLLYVGFWLHDKSHAQAWQRFLVRGAGGIGSGAAWGLAGMAFLAVYREVFETVLFYQALWTQAPEGGAAIVGGLVAGLAALAASAWALLRYSVRMPLGLFFGASGILLAAMGVILAGNGIAALQEAGVVPATPVPFIDVRFLGIHANWQAIAAQLFTAALVVVLFLASRARARAATEARPG